MKFLKDTNFLNGRNYIGASDIATLAGLNKKYNQTPLTLWEVLTKRTEQWTGNESTEWGHLLEGLILKKAIEKLGHKNYSERFYFDKIKGKNKTFFQNEIAFYNNTEALCPHFKHLTAHADLVIDDFKNPKIIEAKSSKFFASKRKDEEETVDGYSMKDFSANGIPLKVRLQVQAQLMCYNVESAHVALLADTSSHKLYGEIKKDVKTQEYILALCEKFWQCVEKDIPPKPETWADILRLYPEIDEETKAVISGEEEQKVLIMKNQYKRYSKAISKLQGRQEDIKNAIGLLIGENKYLENAEGENLAKTFMTERETISLNDIKEKFPSDYKKYLKEELIKKSKTRSIRL